MCTFQILESNTEKKAQKKPIYEYPILLYGVYVHCKFIGGVGNIMFVFIFIFYGDTEKSDLICGYSIS